MQKASLISGLGMVLACGLVGLAACGGDDDENDPGGAADGAVDLPDGARPGPDGAVIGPDGAVLPPPTLEAGFVRLGVIATVSGGMPIWRLRMYGRGGYVQPDGTNRACGVPELHEGCVVETCSDGDGGTGQVDAGAGPAWSGVVTIVDETRPITVVTDLASLDYSTSASVVQILPDLAPVQPGDVLHVTAANVPGFPAVDLRLAMPPTATIALGTDSLSISQPTPFASVPVPGTLRLDLSEDLVTASRTATCFFDRTLGQYAIPPASALTFLCGANGVRIFPVATSRALVGAAGVDQALVYVAVGDVTTSATTVGCSP